MGTGKTSILRRFVHNTFTSHYKSTIGVDFALKIIQNEPDMMISLQLWDIAGQERFGNITRVYYKGAVGAFVVYDVSRATTFENVLRWKNDIDTKVQLPKDGGNIPVVLLANKVIIVISLSIIKGPRIFLLTKRCTIFFFRLTNMQISKVKKKWTIFV